MISNNRVARQEKTFHREGREENAKKSILLKLFFAFPSRSSRLRGESHNQKHTWSQ
jgi:hypothetical protein